jgi:hypothetical protein
VTSFIAVPQLTTTSVIVAAVKTICRGTVPDDTIGGTGYFVENDGASEKVGAC